MAADSVASAAVASVAEPEHLQIKFWGTRGTCPSPGAHTLRYGGNTSCIEVRSATGELLVLDAGTGIRALGDALQRARAPGRQRFADGADDNGQHVVHVVLSHRHGDHVLGLPHFAPLLAGSHTVCLHCGNSDAATLRPFIQALLSPPIFPLLDGVTKHLDMCDWSDGDDASMGTALRVQRLPANHPGEAAVLRVHQGTRAVMAYAPDNELAYGSDNAVLIAWRRGLADALRDIPLLVHDATYRERELSRHTGWGHSSAEEATRFALECGARRLVLFHHHPDRSDDDVDEMLRECREMAGNALDVSAAREGDELVV